MNEFARMLEVQIPGLRRYAGAPTRDVIRADDLVQSCLTRAVARQHLWQYGTDLRAWLFTIMHNQDVNDMRRGVREGKNVELDEAPQLMVQSNAIPTLQLRDLERAIGKLPHKPREVMPLVGLEVMACEEVAKIPIAHPFSLLDTRAKLELPFAKKALDHVLVSRHASPPLVRLSVWLDQSIGADGWAMTPSGMRGNRSLPGRRGDSRARSWLDGASMDGLLRAIKSLRLVLTHCSPYTDLRPTPSHAFPMR